MVINKNVTFVLGSSGFLGKKFVLSFAAVDNKIIAIDIQLPDYKCEKANFLCLNLISDTNKLDLLFKMHKPEKCIVFSGSSSVQDSFLNPFNDFSNSLILSANVLESIRKYSPLTKVLFASSAAVYGNPLTLPIKEEQEKTPISPYGFNKLMVEILAKQYVEIFNLKISIMRIFSAYGIGLRKQIVWDLCEKISKNQVIELYGSGQETRDFINSQDIFFAANLIFENAKFNADIYNVGSGKEIKIKDLAQIVLDCFRDYKNINAKSIKFKNNTRQGDPLRWIANINRIEKFGFVAQIPIKQGIEDYVNWYKSTG